MSLDPISADLAVPLQTFIDKLSHGYDTYTRAIPTPGWPQIPKRHGTGDHQLLSHINQSEHYGFTPIDPTIRRPQTLKRHGWAITNSPYIN